MAVASRSIETSVDQHAERWVPRPHEVSPAVARMHERLRAARVPSARVSTSAFSDAHTDARAEALDAMAGGTAAIERAPTPARMPSHLAETVERFVRLRGRSGRTYVFSRIEPRHVSLYRNGVFATAVRGADRATVIGDVAPILSNAVSDELLYVHLLSETDGDRAAVVTDLS